MEVLPGGETGGGGEEASSAPKPRARKKATYLFTITIAGYPVHVFRAKLRRELANFREDTHEIYLNTRHASFVQAIDAVLHETLHAVSSILLVPELRLKEEQVSTVATALVAAYLSNPDLRAFVAGLLASEKATPPLGQQ